MNPLLNELSRKLLGQANLADCHVQELEEKAARYPAFASLQLLLAARKKQLNPDSVSTFSGKAAFFLHNPLWAEECWQTSAEIISSRELEPVSVTDELPSTPALDTPYQAELETAFTAEELVVQTGAVESKEQAENPDAQGWDNAEEDEELAAENLSEIEKPFPAIPGPLPVASATTAKSASDLLTFEPYHTVDYFASQGIRYREEQKEKDRFSVQLRSFTEWLKTMKRLPVSEQVAISSVSEEKKVEQMAEVSIAPREIVTETMAEVWEKQGNREKAIQLYQKLSLLDPAKSAYFAAKIDKLKHS